MYIGCVRVLTQDQSLSLQLDALYVQWDPPRLYEIETDEGFSLEDLPQEPGRLKLNALGWVKHRELGQARSAGCGELPRGHPVAPGEVGLSIGAAWAELGEESRCQSFSMRDIFTRAAWQPSRRACP
jgi:hypothetical protein